MGGRRVLKVETGTGAVSSVGAEGGVGERA